MAGTQSTAAGSREAGSGLCLNHEPNANPSSLFLENLPVSAPSWFTPWLQESPLQPDTRSEVCTRSFLPLQPCFSSTTRAKTGLDPARPSGPTASRHQLSGIGRLTGLTWACTCERSPWTTPPHTAVPLGPEFLVPPHTQEAAHGSATPPGLLQATDGHSSQNTAGTDASVHSG